MNLKNLVLLGVLILITLFIGITINDRFINPGGNVIYTPKEFSVTGEGKVDVVPDTAYIDAGITTNALTVSEAQTKIADISNKIISAVQKLGVPKEGIKTSNYSVYPSYTYNSGENKISGYNGNATVTIKTKNLKLTSQIIEEVTKAGANQLGSARFDVDDPTRYKEEARNKAIKNAKDQAKRLAESLGFKLGKITNFTETPSQIYPLPIYSRTAQLQGTLKTQDSSPNIEPGTQTVTSTVTLYFERK